MSDFDKPTLDEMVERRERLRVMAFEEIVEDPTAPAESVTPSDIAPAPADEPEPPFAPVAVTYDRVPAVTVPLLHPFKAGGVRVRSVSLRPPRLDYVEARAAGRITRLELVAEMTGLSAEALGAMRWPDAERVLSFAADIAPDVAA
jgi:hypothetical protein